MYMRLHTCVYAYAKSFFSSAFRACPLYQHVKDPRNQLIASAKVRQMKRVQKNKSQLTNNNILSTDFQQITFFEIMKNKIRYGILLFP